MDTDEVKNIIKIDQKYHISMISPLAWPYEIKKRPERRDVEEFVTGL